MGLFDNVASLAFGDSLASLVIENGLSDAIDTMSAMPGNEGQQSVLENYVIPAFIDAAQSTSAGEGWPGIDIGEYMDFMGEIVEAGDSIMQQAYEFAAEIEADAQASEEFDEETGESTEL